MDRLTPDSPIILHTFLQRHEEFQKKQEDFYETAAAELMSLEELDRCQRFHGGKIGDDEKES